MYGDTSTPNIDLDLIQSSRPNWAQDMNDNLVKIDAVLGSYFTINNLKGIWANSTVYNAGDVVVDSATGTLWKCETANTSSKAPTTFTQERIKNAAFWSIYSSPIRSRGAWTPNTIYSLNDIVISGSRYAVCVIAGTSGATFDGDLALGYWSILIDLSMVGTAVLPVPGGAPDANKITGLNPQGTGYTNISASQLLQILGGTSIGVAVFQATTQDAARTAIGAQATDAELALKEDKANKDVANGYPSLDANGTVPLSEISYVRNYSAPNVVRRTSRDKSAEIVSVRDFANAGGGVPVSGNVTTSFMRAFNYLLSVGGGKMIVTPADTGQYTLDPITITGPNSGTNSIIIEGSGPNTVIQPSGACPILIDVQGSYFEMRDMLFNDPSSFVTQDIIRIYKVVADNIPTRFSKLKFTTIACNAFGIDGADNVGWDDINLLNVSVGMNNRSGGVSNYIDKWVHQGCDTSIILDATVGPPVLQAEGFSLKNAVILPAKNNGNGIHIKDGFLTQMDSIVIGQLESGGVGLFLDGTDMGKAVAGTEIDKIWFDGAAGATGLKVRGNVSDMMIDKLILGGASTFVGIDADSLNRFTIADASTFGVMSKAAQFTNSCVGRVVASNLTNGGGTITEDSSCTIRWENTDNQGVPAVGSRSLLSSYPYASWNSYVPVVTPSAGAFGTAGNTPTVTGKYLRNGKKIKFCASVAFGAAGNGTGSGSVIFSLPIAATTALPFSTCNGVEYVATGKGVTGVISGVGVLINFSADGTYPGGNSSTIIVDGEYEAA